MKRILLLAAAIIAISSTTSKAQVNLSGAIFYDSTSNADTFKVWLIVKQGNILSAVDSQIVAGMAGSASYSFSGVTQGSYRVKAHHLNPNSFVSAMVPTYHDSVLLWSNAKLISIGGQNSTNNYIYMKKGIRTNGPGFIGGNVLQGANKGTANGIAGMDMFLFDGNGDLVTHVVTDANGDYQFSSLPNGTYNVSPEQMNYTTTGASITIDATNPSHTAVNFERSNQNKTINLKPTTITNVNGQDVFTVYPNPVSSAVNISWANANGEKANIRIVDITGKQVVNTTVTMTGVTTVDVSTMPSGLYLMNINDGRSNYTHKLTVE